MAEHDGTTSRPGQQRWGVFAEPGEPRSPGTVTVVGTGAPVGPEAPAAVVETADVEADAPARKTIHVLEAELERKERLLEDVIEQYERLLSERNRQQTTRPDDAVAGPSLPAWPTSFLDRWR